MTHCGHFSVPGYVVLRELFMYVAFMVGLPLYTIVFVVSVSFAFAVGTFRGWVFKITNRR